MRTKQEVENGIRCLKQVELKEILLEVLDLIQDPLDQLDYTNRDFELLSERISNIETCLQNNDEELDITALRL